MSEQQRYVPRFHNGFWRVWDLQEYGPVDVSRDMGTPWLKLESVCIDFTKWLNETYPT